MASDIITAAALGRPFTLGMLYNARTDELIPGLTLWDDGTLEETITGRSQHSSKFDISASDSTESKSSLLGIDASLQASVLSGLIEVGGSAKYLNDWKKFKNQSRVMCHYKATTHFKQLSVNNLESLDAQQKDVIEKSSATHVVTGILYGANAFFVFDSEKLGASRTQDIQDSMDAVIKKIPSFNVQGKVDMKLSDEEKALTKTFSCKFYGDFILESNPTTFEDAVKTYVQLPKLLGKNGENSVPVKVWLMPLKRIYSEAAELKSGISVGLVRKAQEALEDLREIGMRCNDSLEDRVVKNFPQIRGQISSFQKLCGYYETKLQQAMAEKLPSIRDGKENESSAEKLFKDRDKSPFSHENLSKWMDDKEREINIIRSCVDIMKGTKIVQDQSQLDKEVLAPGVDVALCFVFTSLKHADPCLDAMANCLDPSSKTGSTNEDQWYFSEEVLTTMTEKAKAFNGMAKGLMNSSRFSFLVSAIANKKYTGATIYHYQKGILITDDFSKPDLPPVEDITDRRDMIWYACDLTLDTNTVNWFLTLSEGKKKVAFGQYRQYPPHPERFDRHPQVLCREGLSGRHYWEVEWGTHETESVYIAVAYKQIERKATSSQTQFGNNNISWAFGHSLSYPQRFLRAWHNGDKWQSYFPSTGCSRVGVYLDWPNGTLSFYRVSSNTLSHLHTFTTTFTGPVYPGFWIYNKASSYAYLCPIE